MSEHDNFSNNMTPERDFGGRPDLIGMKQPERLGLGGWGRKNEFDQTISDYKGSDQTKRDEAWKKLEKLGKQTPADLITQARVQLAADYQKEKDTDELKKEWAENFEVRSRDDNPAYKDSKELQGKKPTAGIAAEVYRTEVEFLQYQRSQNRKPDPNREKPKAFYDRPSFDYINPRNNQSNQTRPPASPTVPSVSSQSAATTLPNTRAGGGGAPPPTAHGVIPFADERDWTPNRSPYAINSGSGSSSASEEYLRRIAESSDESAPDLIRIPEPSPELGEAGWVITLFDWLDRAEDLAEREKQTSYEDQDSKIWLAIERLLDKVPDRMGARDRFLSERFKSQYPEGIYLKEKLGLYYNARKRLMDRYIEADRAGGSLSSYGVNREEMSIEVLKNPLTEVEPMDWWMVIHTDEIFADEIDTAPDGAVSPEQRGEILANVDDALSVWWNVGALAYNDTREINRYLRREGLGQISVTFKDTLNDRDKEDTLRAEIQGILWQLNDNKQAGVNQPAGQIRVLRKGEQLANRIFTATLTFPLFDKERKSFQGKGEERDVMHIDRKRLTDYMEKGRVPGNQWTIGRYWNSPGQHDLQPKAGMEASVAKYRKQMIEINAERGVFALPSEGFDKGELISDYFHTTIGTKDELTGKSVYVKLINFAVDKTGAAKLGGWKQIPFYNLGENSYSGYFTYNMGIASNIAESLGKGGYKPEELQDQVIWGKKKTLLDRLESMSPWYNTAEYDYRGYHLRRELVARGFDETKVKRIAGYSGRRDLEGYGFSDAEMTQIQDIAQGEGFSGVYGKVSGNLAEVAKKDADVFKEKQQHKFRMVAGLGDIWDGSLDYIRGIGAFDASSRFSAADARKIVQAIKQSGYLYGEYLEQFEREVQEMGFGKRIPLGSLGEVNRYRIKRN